MNMNVLLDEAEVNFLQDIVILKTNQLEACEADVPVPK